MGNHDASDTWSLYLPDPHKEYPYFFFNDTATTEIYTLSLHDALPISRSFIDCSDSTPLQSGSCRDCRSEEHTSELQSQSNLVCRLLLEKKNTRSRERVPASA